MFGWCVGEQEVVGGGCVVEAVMGLGEWVEVRKAGIVAEGWGVAERASGTWNGMAFRL